MPALMARLLPSIMESTPSPLSLAWLTKGLYVASESTLYRLLCVKPAS